MDTQYTAAENELRSPIRLKRTGDASGEIYVTLRFTEMPSGKVTGEIGGWGPGTTEQFVPLPYNMNDVYYNPGRSYIIKIVAVDGGGAIGSPDTATLTVIDDEQLPQVSINDISVVEGDPPENGTAFTTARLASCATSRSIT